MAEKLEAQTCICWFELFAARSGASERLWKDHVGTCACSLSHTDVCEAFLARRDEQYLEIALGARLFNLWSTRVVV